MKMPIFKDEVSYVGRARIKRAIKRPLFLHSIPAGFPSSVGDECEFLFDLNELIHKNIGSTYYLKVLDYSMENARIAKGDIVVIDRAIPAQSGNVVIASIHDVFMIKRFIKKGKKNFLQSENLHYPMIELTEGFEIWGTVTYVIQQMMMF